VESKKPAGKSRFGGGSTVALSAGAASVRSNVSVADVTPVKNRVGPFGGSLRDLPRLGALNSPFTVNGSKPGSVTNTSVVALPTDFTDDVQKQFITDALQGKALGRSLNGVPLPALM